MSVTGHTTPDCESDVQNFVNCFGRSSGRTIDKVAQVCDQSSEDWIVKSELWFFKMYFVLMIDLYKLYMLIFTCIYGVFSAWEVTTECPYLVVDDESVICVF